MSTARDRETPDVDLAIGAVRVFLSDLVGLLDDNDLELRRIALASLLRRIAESRRQ